ncbi:outer membrane lipoprotein-sorting protein [Granulicella sp. dw_53]|uniref:outer membrane lipoprotein-sorting protein n=1 Tax=Granulicella sp. dw_53 TaxID=2719792 RepID=UPI001BD697DC|nr:outer membrane lipoprotein-sorting protein [Granulicella sp. dw_53]
MIRLHRFGRMAGVGLVGMVMGATGAAAQGPTANEIVTRMLEKNQERLVALESYETERTYRVDYKGTGGHHEAEMRIRVEYTAPERKKMTVLSETGSKFLCQKILHKLVESEEEATAKTNRTQMSLSAENYTAELEGEETLDGIRTWVLKVVPKVDNKFTYRGRVWVSQDDYAMMRVVGEPAKNPSWWINHANFDSRYMRRGEVWVPQRNVSTSHVRIGGEATLTIDYGEYAVLAARPLKQGPEQAAALAAMR